MAYLAEYCTGMQVTSALPPGMEERLDNNGTPFFVDTTTNVTQWSDPRVDAMNTVNFEAIRRTLFRVVYKIRFIQRETKMDRIDFKAVKTGLEAFHIGDNGDQLLTSNQIREMLTRMFTDIAPNPTASAALFGNWLLSVYDRKHQGTITVRDFKIAVTIMCQPSRNLQEKFGDHFSAIDSDQDGQASPADIERYLTSICKILFTIGEGADMRVSTDNINGVVTALFSGNTIKVPFATFVRWCMVEPLLLAWIRLLSRVFFAENHSVDKICYVRGCRPMRGLIYRPQKFLRDLVCERCYIEGLEHGRFSSGTPVREYVLDPSEPNKLMDTWKKFKKTGKSYRSNKLAPNYVSQRGAFLEMKRKELEDAHKISAARERARQELLQQQALLAQQQQLLLQQQMLAQQNQKPEARRNPAHPKVLTVYDQETHALIAQFASRVGQLESGMPVAALPPYRRPPSIVFDNNVGTEVKETSSIGTQSIPTDDIGTQTDWTPAPLPTIEEKTLTGTSDQINAAIEQLSSMVDETENEGPSFGEQLLHAARGVADTTSALVLQAAAIKRAEVNYSGRPEAEVQQWTLTVNEKAAKMHEAARQLCDVMTLDQLGKASEEDVVKSAAAVKAASQELLDACAATESTHASPMPNPTVTSTIRSRSSARLPAHTQRQEPETKEVLDELAYANAKPIPSAASDKSSDDSIPESHFYGNLPAQKTFSAPVYTVPGSVPSRSEVKTSSKDNVYGNQASDSIIYANASTNSSTVPGSESDHDAEDAVALKSARKHSDSGSTSSNRSSDSKDSKEIYDKTKLRPISSITPLEKQTLKRAESSKKGANERWRNIQFGIEEISGLEIPGLTENNVAKELPKKLKDGVVVCKLLNAVLREKKITEVPINEPEAGSKLLTIRIMENMEQFRGGCQRLGLSEAEICNTFDLIEGRGTAEVLNCLEAIIYRSREASE